MVYMTRQFVRHMDGRAEYQYRLFHKKENAVAYLVSCETARLTKNREEYAQQVSYCLDKYNCHGDACIIEIGNFEDEGDC